MAIPACLSREVCVKVKLYLSNLTYGLELRVVTEKNEITDTNGEF